MGKLTKLKMSNNFILMRVPDIVKKTKLRKNPKGRFGVMLDLVYIYLLLAMTELFIKKCIFPHILVTDKE